MILLAAEGPEKLQQFIATTSLLPFLVMLSALPLALLAAARLRGPLARTAKRLDASPGMSLLVGATCFVLVLVLLLGSGASPAIAVPALLCAAATVALALLGLVAEARRLGAELRGREIDPGTAEGGSAAVGWLVLAGLPLLPLAGPLALLYLALRAPGAAVLSVGGR